MNEPLQNEAPRPVAEEELNESTLEELTGGTGGATGGPALPHH